jgi:Leucine-rich repeat (LRR) protein
LSAIPEEVYNQAPKLVHLNFSKNQLTDVPQEHFRVMVNLTHLILAHNQLTSLPECLGFLPALKILDVNHNKLTHILDGTCLSAYCERIPATICFLTSLDTLDITKNHITELPRNLGLMRDLHVIRANKNPLKGVPKEIQAVSDQLLSYLKNITQGSKAFARMKLMFVGNGNIGTYTSYDYN